MFLNYFNGKSQLILSFILIIPCQILWGKLQPGLLSEKATDSIPDVYNRIISNNPDIRAELLDELVVYENKGDVGDLFLRYSLTDSDYSIILQKALPGLNHLSEKKQHQLLAKIVFLSQKHTLQGVDSAIVPFVQSSSRGISKTALKLLVHLQSPLASPFLCNELKSGETIKIYNALQDLVKIHAVDASPQIAPLLRHNEENIRLSAANALFHLQAKDRKEEMYRVLIENKKEEDINPYFLAILACWEDKRVYPLIMNRLAAKGNYPGDSMADRLVEVNASAIEDSVIDFLENRNLDNVDIGTQSNIKSNAMRILSRLKSKKAIPVLIEIMNGNSTASATAIEALGNLHAQEAVPHLIQVLDRRNENPYYPSLGENNYLCDVTLQALAKIGSPSTVERILKELQSRKKTAVSVEILQTLTRISSPRIYQMLSEYRIPAYQSLSFEAYLAYIKDAVQIPIIFSRDISPEAMKRVVIVREGEFALQTLQNVNETLNYDGYAYAFFLEKDAIHFLTIEETYEKWNEWLKTRNVHL